MKKFSLLKYLDPYDSYDDLSQLSDNDRNYFKSHKKSEILQKGMDETEDILTQLNSILNYMEDDRYMSNFVFGRDGKADEREQIKSMISRIRDELMKLYKLKSSVKSKNHFRKK